MNRILIDERLYTKRLYLRSRIYDDNVFIFEATQYPGFNDGMPWNPLKSIEESDEKYRQSQNKWINGTSYSFIGVQKETNKRVGMISIRKESEDGKWSIGYWTHPEMQNMGYMTEMVEEIIKFGFERLSAESIEAKCAIWNEASEKVLLKSGMNVKEHLEKGFEKNGKWIEENRMEIGIKEWKSIKSRRLTQC